MVSNYLKIALRNLWRERGYATLNVLGLATGVAVCALIFSYVRFETSYDEFHERADRIVRIVEEETAYSPGPLAGALKSSVPQVENAVRVSDWGDAENRVRRGNRVFYEERIYFADSSFFEVFSYPLKRGDPDAVLDRPSSVVLTEPLAEKYFGNQNPVGETLEIETRNGEREYEVTGVAEEVPANTHIPFRAIMSFPESTSSWPGWGPMTYAVLEPGASREAFRRGLEELVTQRAETETAARLQVQPLTSIHLHSHLNEELEAPGNPQSLLVFSTLALLVLLLAGVNYVNLAVARATRRASEVGIRKAVGGSRRQLAQQFLGEAVVVGVLGGLAGFGLVQLGLPGLGEITGIPTAAFPGTGLEALLQTLGGGLLVGMLAGGYPAALLSRMEPANVLRSGGAVTGRAGTFRKGLVVAQFAISVAFIAGTLIIRAQIGYMQSKELGFQEEQVISLAVRDAVDEEFGAFKQELVRDPAIQGVTASNWPLPTPRLWSNLLRPEGLSTKEMRKRVEEGSFAINTVSVDPNFTEVLEIPVVRGRAFEEQVSKEREYTPALVNQTAVRDFGWENPIGKTFPCCFRPTPRVVGVVPDFHYTSLDRAIQPLVLMKGPGIGYPHVYVRFEGQDASQVIAHLRATWEQFGDGAPLDYTFLDDRFRQAYQSHERVASLSGVFSVIAIILAGMGLFGLASYSVSRRTKEISIRKVLGATTERVVALVSGDFLKLVGIGFLVGVPVALIAMNRWLENFAYRIELGPIHFISAGGLVLVVALIAVGYQSMTAALLNPAETLKYE